MISSNHDMASHSLDLSSGADFEEDDEGQQARQLPLDLPRTLDDRRPVQINSGLEVYDEWAGKTSILSFHDARR